MDEEVCLLQHVLWALFSALIFWISFGVLEAACVAWLQVQHVSSRYELCQLVGVKANCDLYAVEGAWDCTNWLWLG